MKTRLAALALGLLALVVPSFAVAQDTDDEDLEDQQRRDEEYLRRRTAPADEAADQPADEEARAEKFLAAADRLIRDRNYRSAQSARYRIQTDDPRLDLSAVSSLLETFAGFFDELWPAEPAQPAEPTRAFLFYSYHKYDRLLEGDFSREIARPAGHYGPAFGALVVHSDPDGAQGLAEILVHEAAHERVDRRLYPGDARPSTWVAEGLATYLENTLLDASGTFQAGVVGGKHVALVRGSRPAMRTDARARLARVREALAGSGGSETPIALSVASANEPSGFYGPGALERYDVSWVLVHYLLHGDGGRYKDGFARFLALDAAGRGDVEGLERETGLELATLDGKLLEHVRSIRVK